jgi:hypothetical protein
MRALGLGDPCGSGLPLGEQALTQFGLGLAHDVAIEQHREPLFRCRRAPDRRGGLSRHRLDRGGQRVFGGAPSSNDKPPCRISGISARLFGRESSLLLSGRREDAGELLGRDGDVD